MKVWVVGYHHVCAFIMTQWMHLNANATLRHINISST
jgi:hypothetical protein